MTERVSGIDRLNNKVQQIQEDLRKVRESVLSETKRKEKFEQIRKRAETTKKELEQTIGTLEAQAKEEAQVLLNSLNEIINFKLSICDSGNPSSHTPSDGTEPGFFSKTKDWIGNQRNEISWDNLKEKPVATVLRTTGFALTGIGAVALTYKGVKKLWNRAFSDDDEEEEETQESEESDTKSNKKKEKKSFWDRRYGKTLKWLGFGAGAVGGSYLLGRYFSNRENSADTMAKEKVKEMQSFESDVKNLKNQANDCLRLSSTYVVDHEKNKENYDKILAEALDIQERNNTVFDEFSKSNASEKLKEKAQTIKNNIENYINEIKDMDEEISKNLPKTKNWWGDNENKPEGNADNIDENKPVDSSVISEAVINYIDSNVNFVELNDDMKKRIKTRMNKYLKSYPILKKDKDNHITFEIGNKTEFSSMVKDLWNIVLSGMSREKRGAAILIFGNGIGDLDKSMKNLDSDKYEKLVFNYFGGIIKNIVKSEGGNMTVQEYYDSISRYYPNKHADKISTDLASSGQSDKDIKDMRYPLI